jgi:hypothetical protein
MSKIIMPLAYSTSIGERGVFRDRTGRTDSIVIFSNNISIFPSWEDQNNLSLRHVIRARLRDSNNISIATAFKYYATGVQFAITNIKPNINWLLEIQLMELETIADKNNALSGRTFEIKQSGVLNVFRFRHASLIG